MWKYKYKVSETKAKETKYSAAVHNSLGHKIAIFRDSTLKICPFLYSKNITHLIRLLWPFILYKNE